MAPEWVTRGDESVWRRNFDFTTLTLSSGLQVVLERVIEAANFVGESMGVRVLRSSSCVCLAVTMAGCSPRVDASAGGAVSSGVATDSSSATVETGGTAASTTAADGTTSTTNDAFSVRITLAATIRGTATGQGVGRALEFAGDHNSDGIEDLLIGQTEGRAYLIYGGALPTELELSGPVAEGRGKTFEVERYANAAAAGDADGDGLPDVVFVQPKDEPFDETRIHLVYSAVGDAVIDVDALVGTPRVATLTKEGSSSEHLGVARPETGRVIGHSDVTGDGRDELILGGKGLGYVYVVLGFPRGEVPTLDDVEVGVGGVQIDASSYISDSVLGIPPEVGRTGGAVLVAGDYLAWLISGPLTENILCLPSLTCGVQFSVDGEPGVVAAYGGGANPGARRIVMGPGLIGKIDYAVDVFSAVDGALVGGYFTVGDENLGDQVAFVGDIDGDGVEDLAMGASFPRRTYVTLSNESDDYVDIDEEVAVGRAAVVQGDEPGDDVVPLLVGGKDLTGDGIADMVISAPGDIGHPGGAVYVYTLSVE